VDSRPIPQKKTALQSVMNMAVLVAALGYFVDIYDLILFNVIKEASLIGIGISALDKERLQEVGFALYNWQMYGMLTGGILWGILGDKRGRLSVLFGSIIIYSAANIVNGFVTDINTYAAVRFIAGVGLAGELGAGVTLVSESMSKEQRGYGTMLIVVVGALGAVFAAQIGAHFHWTTAYFVGGGLGLVLLALRISVFESGMYKNMEKTNAKRGSFFQLFSNWKIFFKYLNCILIGLPIWFTVAVLINSSNKFGEILGVQGKVVVGQSVMYTYIGLSVGGLFVGLLSQALKSRKKVVLICLAMLYAFVLLYLFLTGLSLFEFYTICFLLGFATGFWALFVTIASEQFGTNIRSTVTTTVPNFVRGSVPLITSCYLFLVKNQIANNIYSALIVGTVCFLLSIVAILNVKETFGKDLNYIEP